MTNYRYVSGNPDYYGYQNRPFDSFQSILMTRCDITAFLKPSNYFFALRLAQRGQFYPYPCGIAALNGKSDKRFAK